MSRFGWFLPLLACSPESAFEWSEIGFSGSSEVGGSCTLFYGDGEVDFVTIDCVAASCTCLDGEGATGSLFEDEAFCRQASDAFEGTQNAQRRLTHDVVARCGDPVVP
jgi:hypothetical protein